MQKEGVRSNVQVFDICLLQPGPSFEDLRRT